jgi:hypothetical protein
MFKELTAAMIVAEGTQKIMDFERFGRLVSNLSGKMKPYIKGHRFICLVTECITELELSSNSKYYRSAVGSFFGKHKEKEEVVEEEIDKTLCVKNKKTYTEDSQAHLDLKDPNEQILQMHEY